MTPYVAFPRDGECLLRDRFGHEERPARLHLLYRLFLIHKGENMMTGSFDIGFTTLKQEIVSDALPVRGILPSWLSGTLLRTGPAQFEVGQHKYRHWFDGLAMLHRFSFHDGTVSYANRFLQSKTYQANREAGKITYAEFATDPCRSLFKRLATTFTREVSDNANVSISQLGDDFVALTEVPLPVMFDPQPLETLGRSGRGCIGLPRHNHRARSVPGEFNRTEQSCNVTRRIATLPHSAGRGDQRVRRAL
jgi:Retinal pigment epithelial membrane protein